MTLHRSADSRRPAFGGGSVSPRLGERILQTPEFFINWHGGRFALTVTARGHKRTEAGVGHYPEYTFEGEDGLNALIVFQVAFLRGGVQGLREVIHEVFGPRTDIAEGIYLAERNSYRRINGMIIRDVEA